jgi:putative transposase
MNRYPSDLTDNEWKIIEEILISHYPRYSDDRPKGGRVMFHDMREILNAIFYVIKSGVQWNMLPKDFPPKDTVKNHFYKMIKMKVFDKILEITNKKVREKNNRHPDPSLGIIDSQSVKPHI